MDPKWPVVARRASCRVADVAAIWWALEDYASQQDDRGSIEGFDPEQAAVYFQIEQTAVQAVMQALADKQCLTGKRIANWEEYQPEETSTDRVQRYRGRLTSSGQSITGYLRHRAALMERDGNACVYCLSAESLVIDHMHPVQKGGTHDQDNLAIACKSCNSGKAGRTPEEARLTFRSKAASEAYERYKLSPRHRDTQIKHGDTSISRSSSQSESSEREDAPDLEAEFALWYDKFPRKQAPGRALKAFRAARKKTDLTTLVSGVVAYVANKPGYADWCLPASWLSDERWLDEHGKSGVVVAVAAPKFGPKAFVPTDAHWPLRLAGFRKNGYWATSWGPRPGESGCGCPAELLKATA